MKFIREIIGEKRQMEARRSDVSDEAPEAEASVSPLEKLNGLSFDEPAPAEAAAPAEDTAETDTSVEEKVYDITSDDDVSDDIAAFFKDDDEDEAIQPEEDAQPEPALTPEKLGLETIDEAEDIAEDATATDDPETETEESVAAKIDRILVSEHTPDPTLEDVFRATPDQPQEDPVSEYEPEQDVEPEPRTEAPIAASPDQETAQEIAPEPAPTPEPEVAAVAPAQPAADPAPEAPISQSVEVPQPAVGRGTSRHGRVKTRLLGFNTAMDTGIDPIAESKEATAAPYTSFPVGWLIVIDGPGRGSAFTLFNGVSNIGRGESQTVRLNFGDNSISRENHASVAYDPRQQSFFIGHGGKANIVRRNDRPVLSTEEMTSGDHITIGETTLRFVPFCGPDFTWETAQSAGLAHATRD